MRKLSSVPISVRCCVSTTLRRSAASSAFFAASSARRVTKRAKISPAAARENVSATISRGLAPSFNARTMRSTKVKVLPVPALASIS